MAAALKPGIFAFLSRAAPLVALQGSRVYPTTLPENPTLPATTYQVIGGGQDSNLDNSGMQRRRVQINHHASSDLAADQLREATIDLLDGFQGPLPNGLVILVCEFIQPIDRFDNDARQYVCAEEFYFYFNS